MNGRYITKEQFKDIHSYKLLVNEGKILNLNKNGFIIEDSIKILTILEKCSVNYKIDEEYNFEILPFL